MIVRDATAREGRFVRYSADFTTMHALIDTSAPIVAGQTAPSACRVKQPSIRRTRLEPRLSIRPAHGCGTFVPKDDHSAHEMRLLGLRGPRSPLVGQLARDAGEVFNLACDRHAQSASIMGFAPSRVLMDNLG